MDGSLWRNRKAVLTLIACCATLSTPARAEQAREERQAITARQVRGGGGWERDGRGAARAGQHWDIDVTRADDGRLEGEVTLAGSTLMGRGTLRGTINGRRVNGQIADANGNPVADFVGVVASDGGMRGTYQDRTGEVGRWNWDGPPPR